MMKKNIFIFLCCYAASTFSAPHNLERLMEDKFFSGDRSNPRANVFFLRATRMELGQDAYKEHADELHMHQDLVLSSKISSGITFTNDATPKHQAFFDTMLKGFLKIVKRKSKSIFASADSAIYFHLAHLQHTNAGRHPIIARATDLVLHSQDKIHYFKSHPTGAQKAYSEKDNTFYVEHLCHQMASKITQIFSDQLDIVDGAQEHRYLAQRIMLNLNAYINRKVVSLKSALPAVRICPLFPDEMVLASTTYFAASYGTPILKFPRLHQRIRCHKMGFFAFFRLWNPAKQYGTSVKTAGTTAKLRDIDLILGSGFIVEGGRHEYVQRWVQPDQEYNFTLIQKKGRFLFDDDLYFVRGWAKQKHGTCPPLKISSNHQARLLLFARNFSLENNTRIRVQTMYIGD